MLFLSERYNVAKFGKGHSFVVKSIRSDQLINLT